jgi:uncharacterized protein (TIGR03083 family)
VLAHLTQSAQTWRETIIRAAAGDANPPPGQRLLQPGELGSESTAERAIAFRQERRTDELLQVFAQGYDHLCQVLLDLQPEDWDKPCFHRRGVLPTRDYVGIRIQELTIHGWDIRSAFDASATLSERPLAVLVRLVQRWLSSSFSHEPRLAAPVRYRFDIPGPVPIRQDVLVSRDSFTLEPATAADADVTFRCQTGDYILFIYGRFNNLDAAVHTGRLEVVGNHDRAALFPTLFRGV